MSATGAPQPAATEQPMHPVDQLRDRWHWWIALGRADCPVLDDYVRARIAKCGCRECIPADPHEQARAFAERRAQYLKAVTGNVGSIDQHPEVQSRKKRIERGRRLCSVHPPAIQGHGGSTTTYRLTVALVRGLVLIPEIAVVLLDEIYSPRCEPPWSWDELVHKAEDAEYTSEAEWGFLLRDRPQAAAVEGPSNSTTPTITTPSAGWPTATTSWPSPSALPTESSPDPDDLSLARIVGTQRQGTNLERFALRLQILDGPHAGKTKVWRLDWPPTPRSEERWAHLAEALGLDRIRDPRMDTWRREVRVELYKRADGIVEVRRVYPVK